MSCACRRRNARTPTSLLPRSATPGYPHIAISGQKGYHGVAVVSRIPFVTSAKRDFCLKGDARHLHVVFGGDAHGLELHNFYVPAGGDEPDPEINAKFAHKLAFVDEMADWAQREKPAAGRSILVGDLNIAPLEHDVWSHKALLSVVSHTPIEVDKLNRAQAAGPWVDALRKFVPDDQKLYTWWSYRSPDWSKVEQGPPPRPHLGQPGARRLRQVDARPARRPRLGAPFRPRAGHGGIGPVGLCPSSRLREGGSRLAVRMGQSQPRPRRDSRAD